MSNIVVGESRAHSGLLISFAVVVSHTHLFTDHIYIPYGPPFCLHFSVTSVCLLSVPHYCLRRVHVYVCVHVCVWVYVDMSVFHCLLMYYCVAILILLCAQYKEHKKKKKTRQNKHGSLSENIYVIKEKKTYLGSM